MPIYEYRCRDCNANFEELIISSSDSEKVTCTKCKSTNVRKTISAGSYKISGSSAGGGIPMGGMGGCGGGGGFS